MNKFKLGAAIFSGMLFLSFAAGVNAQIEKPSGSERRAGNNRRPNLLAELDLSSEQILAIRRINQQNRSLVRAAQERLRRANDNLDETIYADDIDETQVQTRVRELQDAQIEFIKARATSELAVRRVLTAEQLEKFRDLRRRFRETIESRPNRPTGRLRNLNNRRLNNRQRQMPVPSN